MKCQDCKFYEPHAEHEWAGRCAIKLPPQLQEPANNFASFTLVDNGCDLGQAKDVEADK